MKIWTSEHTFCHPWETVAQASWRKYPNPLNPNVVAIDVLERDVQNGILHSQRLLSSKWIFPGWARKILGNERICYAKEHSTVDPTNRNMTLFTQNLTFCHLMSIDERLSYTAHPEDPTKTLLTQEAVVTVRGIPLSSYLEGFLTTTISQNANKGRQAMEWVIGKLNAEVHDLTTVAAKNLQSLTSPPTVQAASLPEC